MKKGYVLGILFFGTIWGLSEAGLGGWLYAAKVPQASVYLALVAFAVLTVARAYFPQVGTATAIASCAMLYKVLNAQFFACHLLGVVLLGLSYDVVFNGLKFKNRSLSAVTSTYLGFALFAVMITYVVRYPHWADVGWPKVLWYVGVSGSLAAAGNAVLVPLVAHLSERFEQKSSPFAFTSKLATGGVLLVTAALWIVGWGVSF